MPKITQITSLLRHKHTPNAPGKMDDHESVGNGSSSPNDLGALSSPINDDIPNNTESVLVSRSGLAELHYNLQLLQHAQAASEQKSKPTASTNTSSGSLILAVHEQGQLILELVTFNQRTHQAMDDLHSRVSRLEHPQMMPNSAAGRRSRSPSVEHAEYRQRGNYSTRKGGKGGNSLQIQIPGKVYTGPAAGLPTPLTLSAIQTPMTPLTPGRAGPPGPFKKPNTCINKRGIHNLDKMVPPIYAQLPLLPITDTELIVYFFNSLCRPIVSLRLYARGWGPAAISDAINQHRIIEPRYLRNTCSVKCTTAIKKGIEKYGPTWEGTNRAMFEESMGDDVKATDMIRLSEDELPRAVDFELRALCRGLRKYPGEGDAGIFTRCVEFCSMYDANYTLSTVWELASDLDSGRTPSRFASSNHDLKTEDGSASDSEESEDTAGTKE
ncbi:hypothetical protein ACEQ8H_007482 [Pleosporales sp. CAS-2024a]